MKLNKINQLIKKYNKKYYKLQKQINDLIEEFDGCKSSILEKIYWYYKDKQIDYFNKKEVNYKKRKKIHAKINGVEVKK